MKAIKETIYSSALTPWLIAFVYLLLIAPFGLRYLFFLPDEDHYTNAAIYMLQNGDYLTPHLADGTHRFLKPIFTYWAVFVSYLLFGINQFSSRLPFLIAGAFILLVTYKTAKLAFKNNNVAILSMLILGSSPLFAQVVCISITDAFLILFVLISSYGIIGLMIEENDSNKFHWALYLGTGFAIATKGLPAIAFTLIGILFLLSNPWRKINFKKLIHWPSIILGISIGLGWYIAIYFKHGLSALGHFYEDQIGYRVAISFGKILRQMSISTLFVILTLIPFFIPVFLNILTFIKRKETQSKKEFAVIIYILVWIIAMVGMTGMVAKYYYRYIFPVMPIVSIGFSWLILKYITNKQVKIINTTKFILFVIYLFTAIAALMINIVFKQPWSDFILPILLVAFGTLSIVKIKSENIVVNSAMVSFFMIGLFSLSSVIIKPISYPGKGIQINSSLSQIDFDLDSEIQFFGKRRIASRLRVASAGEYDFIAENAKHNKINETTKFVIFSDENKDSLNLADFNIIPISSTWKDFPIAEIIKCKTKQELNELKFKNSENHYMAIRKD